MSALTACSNVLKRKSARSGMRMRKKEGSCGENAEQLKGRGDRLQVHSESIVSDNMTQWLKPQRCQELY